jgi:hypothetical protein
MLTRRILALGAALALAAAPVLAETTDEPAATNLDGVAVEDAGDRLVVSGSVLWGGQAPVMVAEAWGQQHPAGDAGTAAGTELEAAYIAQPDGNVDALEFTWAVTELNAPPPNEVVRYLWQVQIDGQEYWLQAKSSDLTTATMLHEDPAGTATRLSGSFRLRGDCGPLADGANVSSCGHVAWLDGIFDLDANQVRVTVPLDLEEAPLFTAGNVVQQAGDGVQAGFQAGVSNNLTTMQLPMDEDYAIPTKDVTVTVADAAGAVVASGTGVLDGEGGFTAQIGAADLAAGTYSVVATACFAGGCDTVTQTLER